MSSKKGQVFQITSQPSDHSQFAEEFRFTLEQPHGKPNEIPLFIYSRVFGGQQFITTVLDLNRYTNFPIGIVTLGSEKNPKHETRKIYVIGRHRYGAMVSLDDHSHMNCCRRSDIFSFYAFNVSESGTMT